jgi:signal transduction histidine kinase
MFAGMLRDISDIEAARQAREHLIAELEAKNAELERFTYTVSHDLKSPLITIRGFLSFVEQDAVAGNLERVRADLGRIRDAVDKMQRLLSELLELSRIGRVVNPPQTVAFATLAQEAAGLVAGRLRQRGIGVTIADGLPTVWGDRARLVEVLQNLVDNVAKFMGEQKQPRVEIGMREQAGEKVFFVRDNGIGIDPRFRDRVFGLFEKLDPDSEGSGVGLALIKRIVDQHHGRVWVESEGKGKGTTVCFTLPDAQPAAAATAAAEKAPAPR